MNSVRVLTANNLLALTERTISSSDLSAADSIQISGGDWYEGGLGFMWGAGLAGGLLASGPALGAALVVGGALLAYDYFSREN